MNPIAGCRGQCIVTRGEGAGVETGDVYVILIA